MNGAWNSDCETNIVVEILNFNHSLAGINFYLYICNVDALKQIEKKNRIVSFAMENKMKGL